jgi:hypothetical protein
MSEAMDRFLSCVEKLPDQPGCWLWTGSYTGKGYGGFWTGERSVRAHRFSYEAFVGPIPSGLTIDHVCRVRMCVNPAHLRAVTQFENTMIGSSIPAINARKTHCKWGHEFTPENTRVSSTAEGRVCLACKSERNIRYGRQWRRAKAGAR